MTRKINHSRYCLLLFSILSQKVELAFINYTLRLIPVDSVDSTAFRGLIINERQATEVTKIKEEYLGWKKQIPVGIQRQNLFLTLKGFQHCVILVDNWQNVEIGQNSA